jgi:hypothetical protein
MDEMRAGCYCTLPVRTADARWPRHHAAANIGHGWTLGLSIRYQVSYQEW